MDNVRWDRRNGKQQKYTGYKNVAPTTNRTYTSNIPISYTLNLAIGVARQNCSKYVPYMYLTRQPPGERHTTHVQTLYSARIHIYSGTRVVRNYSLQHTSMMCIMLHAQMHVG